MPTSTTATTLLALLLSSSVDANRDDSYYRPGRENPNTYAEKMYWQDGSNVLEDINQFSALYVEFHHCAWTQMKSTGEENSVDENDYFYMGVMPPFGANVAFSLYGAMYNEQFTGCNEDTFINSFYTDYGYEVFSNALYYAGVNGFSYSGYDDDNNGYSSSCGGGYGVGCDYTNGFAVHSYSSDECNPYYFSGVKDTMYDLNSAMNGAQCVQIYDANNYGGYYSGTSLELLAYSSACFYQNFWAPDGQCPDPYGKLAEYQSNFNDGVKKSKSKETFTSYKKQNRQARRMWFVGTLAFLATAVLCVLKLSPRLQQEIATRRQRSKKTASSEPMPSAPSRIEEEESSGASESKVLT